MVKYPYPLPLVPSELEQLREATIFIKLDLCSNYNLLHVYKGNEWKMACSITRGHYEYLVMQYGLSCVPSVLQNFINDVLCNLLGNYVSIY